MWPPICLTTKNFCIFFKKCLEREREKVWVGERQRERETEREREREREREFQAGSVLSGQSTRPGWISWPELKSRVGCLTDWATWASHNKELLYMHLIYLWKGKHRKKIMERNIPKYVQWLFPDSRMNGNSYFLSLDFYVFAYLFIYLFIYF